MTTTKRTTTAPKGDVRTETLDEFDDLLGEYANGETDFAYLVRSLWATREGIKQLDAARKAVFEHVKAAHTLGHTTVAGYRLKMTSPPEPTAYTSVASAAVKTADVAAWRRAQALAPFVQVKAPAGMAVAEEAVPEEAAVDFVAPEAAVVCYKEHPAWARLRELRVVEQETLGRLEKLAADFGWDGDLKVFADGWSVQLRRLQFSAEKLAATDPAVFDRCAVTKLKVVNPHVIVARVRDDGTEDDGVE
ncbi:hypothetical protein SEA_VINCENZO_63 [Mycobacterium phage Vincenzo]|uniref:Uncharacterized protein n=2 Tax=Coopervirus vincenzo TaxID=1983110 RepID=A0A0F6WE08_9CAUD|nr:hypothetical protein SEA_VINCENZO_63 [Mycobacterium phage Vincenzo]AKF14325.1 hypothetical protein SEA_VINCENZO_63 [Mycobacterium phage Vincenzo]AKF14729.1 hypothetical protein SEA_ALANGRANT_64 [Mycobacterium phage AlanGrant]